MPTDTRKLQIIALAALFVVPVAVAWFMYAGQPGDGGAQGAHGVLADPPIELGDIKLPEGGDAGTEAQLAGRWTFLYLQQGDCGPPCENALIRMRQVRLALGKDANRVQRLLVAPVGGSGNGRLAQAFPGMAILPLDYPGPLRVDRTGRIPAAGRNSVGGPAWKPDSQLSARTRSRRPVPGRETPAKAVEDRLIRPGGLVSCHTCIFASERS